MEEKQGSGAHAEPASLGHSSESRCVVVHITYKQKVSFLPFFFWFVDTKKKTREGKGRER
jgi:hypothetical protein